PKAPARQTLVQIMSHGQTLAVASRTCTAPRVLLVCHRLRSRMFSLLWYPGCASFGVKRNSLRGPLPPYRRHEQKSVSLDTSLDPAPCMESHVRAKHPPRTFRWSSYVFTAETVRTYVGTFRP